VILKHANIFHAALLMVLLSSSFSIYSDTLEVEISGLSNENQIENVKAHNGGTWISGSTMSSQRRRNRFLAEAETRTARALRPYGYYFPEIESAVTRSDDQSWLLVLTIQAGVPVTVRDLVLEVKGDGSDLNAIVEWQANWPLVPGVRLNQQSWDQQKQAVLDIAAEQGYLLAGFEASSIELHLEENYADLKLVLDTGPRAVMGEIQYVQDSVNNEVLKSVPRFNSGDFYRAWLVNKFRTDLWRTGYFDEIDVVEQKHLDQQPPRVDFKVTLKERKKNTHQGTIGYGTDSQFRMQYRWQRHLLSDRGDTLGMGLGWQQKNEELLLFGEYRIPRRTRSKQYWLLSSALKTESEDVDVSSQDTGQESHLFSGRVEDFSVRFGKVKLRDIGWSEEQIAETMYVQYLLEKNDFSDVAAEPEGSSFFERSLLEEDDFVDTNHSITLGLDWDWPVIQGKRFNTAGHHERAWLFTANDAWGSEREFSQAYISSRWNFVFADNWKILLRGEVGYTDANVHEIEADIGDDVLIVSVTELPFLYRFKAGGSYSVRGYGFEELSTNNIGSNHILTASAELEYQFKQDWSLAAFYDIGNAFNDWGDTDLKAGIGFGLRWYTIAGAIRIDFAQAQDIAGKPWQFHLTIGTPLL